MTKTMKLHTLVDQQEKSPSSGIQVYKVRLRLKETVKKHDKHAEIM